MGSRVEFAPRAAQLLAVLNKLHPFREGNGRTQRLFLDAVAQQAGHELHFDVASRERMVQASVEANDGNPGMMTRMFEEITDASRIQPLRRAITFLSGQKFDWNETYIATTTPGENYSGRLVGRDGEAFMIRSDDNRIFIGRAVDIDPALRNGERSIGEITHPRAASADFTRSAVNGICRNRTPVASKDSVAERRRDYRDRSLPAP